jgi:uncharacterized protein YndB with AHSA1/START domain
MDKGKTGKVSKQPDGYMVQFERHYPFDIMTVWDAITNPEKISKWFMKVELELKPGGRITFHYEDEQNTVGYGKITAVEKGKLFEYLWENEEGPDELTRCELFAEGPAACRLLFTHQRIDEKYLSAAAGWHVVLSHLEDVLHRGNPIIDEEEENKIKAFYKELIFTTFKKTVQ